MGRSSTPTPFPTETRAQRGRKCGPRLLANDGHYGHFVPASGGPRVWGSPSGVGACNLQKSVVAERMCLGGVWEGEMWRSEQSNRAQIAELFEIRTIQHVTFAWELRAAANACLRLHLEVSVGRKRRDARRYSRPPKADHWIHTSKAPVPLLCTSSAAECNGWVRGHLLRWSWLGLRGWRLWSPATLKGSPTGAFPVLGCNNRATTLPLDDWRLISRLQMSGHDMWLFFLITILDELEGISRVFRGVVQIQKLPTCWVGQQYLLNMQLSWQVRSWKSF